MSHTPGPWEVEVLGHSVRVVANRKGDEFGDDIAGIGSCQDATNMANAHLMAAAPEMLEALKAYSRLDDFHANCEDCDGEVAPEICAACFPFAD